MIAYCMNALVVSLFSVFHHPRAENYLERERERVWINRACKRCHSGERKDEVPRRRRARGFMQCLQRYSSSKYIIADVECPLNCSRKKHFTTKRGIVQVAVLNTTHVTRIYFSSTNDFCRGRISVSQLRPVERERSMLAIVVLVYWSISR